jgi:hypothetical protein
MKILPAATLLEGNLLAKKQRPAMEIRAVRKKTD